MTKLTVLQMVQDIASDMNSDEVNSVVDSAESMQIARIVESSYFEMMANRNWPHLKQLSTLNSSSEASRPTHMVMPSNTKELHSIQYNKVKTGETRSRWEEIEYLTPDAFLRLNNTLNTDNTKVTAVTDVSGVTLLIENEAAPQYYTSFDDNYIIFNSYDSAVDTTLQSSKTQCHITLSPVFTLSDLFVPNLPDEAFPALLAEAKSASFARIKQAPDAKSEQQARRQRGWLSRKNHKAGEGMQFPDYGR